MARKKQRFFNRNNVNSPSYNVTINGEKRTFSAPHSISELLKLLEVNERGMAIEVDGILVPSDQFASFQIADGALIEIVTFVGGG